eukprot:COSAG05_NODE_9172_length_642_cov_1.611418_1_plen_90_part_00
MRLERIVLPAHTDERSPVWSTETWIVSLSEDAPSRDEHHHDGAGSSMPRCPRLNLCFTHEETGLQVLYTLPPYLPPFLLRLFFSMCGSV